MDTASPVERARPAAAHRGAPASAVSRLLSAASVYFGSYAMLAIAGLVSMPIMTRLLSKEEYGLLSLMFTTVAVLSVVAGLGSGDATLRLYGEHYQAGTRYLRQLCETLLTSTFTSGLLVAGATALWAGQSSDHYSRCLVLAGGLVVIRVLSTVLYQIHRAQERAAAYAATQVGVRWATFLLAVPLLLLYEPSAASVLIASIVVEATAVLVRVDGLRRDGLIRTPRLSPAIAATAIKYGAPLTIAGAARFLLDYSDRFVIQRALGLSAVATYSVAYDLAGKLSETVFFPVQLAVLPVLFGLWAEGDHHGAREFAARVLNRMLGFAIPIFVLYALLSGDLIVLIASAKYQDAGALTPFLLPGVALGTMMFIASAGLALEKRTPIIALNVLAAAALNVLLNLLLVPRFGLPAAGVATTVAFVALLAAHYSMSRSTLPLVIERATLVRALTISAIIALVVGRMADLEMGRLMSTLARGSVGLLLLGVLSWLTDAELRAWSGARREDLWARFGWLRTRTGSATSPASFAGVTEPVVGLITKYFPPNTAVASLHAERLVRGLQTHGWQAWAVSHLGTQVDGVPLVATPCPVELALGFDSKSAFGIRGRYWLWSALPDRDVSWLPHALWLTLRQCRGQRPAVLWSSSPPVTAHCIGWAASRLAGIPLVIELRDPWNVDVVFGPLSGRVNRWLERRLLHAASRIMVTTESLATELTRRCGAELGHKIVVLPNGYREVDFIDPVVAPTDRFVLLHAGDCDPQVRDPRPLLRALRLALDRGTVPADSELVLLGAGVPIDAAVAATLAQLGLQAHVRSTARVAHRVALEHIRRAAVLILIQSWRPHRFSIPAKAYEYLRSRAQILALTTPDHATAHLLGDYQGVAVVDPGNVEHIANELAATYGRWLTMRGGRGYLRPVEQYEAGVLAGQLAAVLDAVVKEHHRA